MREKTMQKLLCAVILIFIAIFSAFVLGDFFTSRPFIAQTVASIDEKVNTVLKLTATSTVASAGVSAIPGDTATPIAEKLADFTEYFLLILCVLYAEKYLLTVIGAACFKILIPLACLCCIISLFAGHDSPEKPFRTLALKLGIVGLALFFTIPLSIYVSDMIYANYEGSIEETITAAEDFSEDTSGLAGASDNMISSVLATLSESVSGLSDRAAEIFNSYVEALAVIIVTSCVMPLLVLLFFIWMIRMVTGVDIHFRIPHRRRRHHG